MPTIVVPYRGDAKRRLPASIRAALAVAMLGDVVAAAREVGRVLVVTDDLAVVPPGAESFADPGGGLGAAVGAALALVDGHALVVNADLPARDAGARSGGSPTRGSRSSRPRTGRRTRSHFRIRHVFAPLYGPGSAARFRAHAPFATVEIPELAADVDTDADLERIAQLVGPRTRALLAVHA